MFGEGSAMEDNAAVGAAIATVAAQIGILKARRNGVPTIDTKV
jgi:hypothetical protein